MVENRDWHSIMIYGGLAVSATWGFNVLIESRMPILIALAVAAGVTVHAMGYAFGHDAGRRAGRDEGYTEGYGNGYRRAVDLKDEITPKD